MPGERTLVLGGARSGKSRYAESLLAGHGNVRYAATGYPDDSDLEWVERVRAHRARRPATWSTVETTELSALLADAATPLLIDCISLWLTRVIDAHDGWGTPALPGEVVRLVDGLVEAWRDTGAVAVAVSNEVGMGVVPPSAAGRRFRDELGGLNRRLAAASDVVWLVVAGLPVRVK